MRYRNHHKHPQTQRTGILTEIVDKINTIKLDHLKQLKLMVGFATVCILVDSPGLVLFTGFLLFQVATSQS